MIYPTAPEALLEAMLAAMLSGVITGLLGRADSRRMARVSFAFSVLGCALMAALALGILLDGMSFSLAAGVPGGTSASPLLAVSFSSDPLSGLFLFLLGFVGGAISVASLGYVDRYVHERPATLASFFALFLATMALVVLAGTVFAFLLAWEAMTLVSYFLVVHEHSAWEVRRAGLTYLVMSHAAAAAILVSMILLSIGTGTTSFAQMATLAGGLSPLVRDCVFLAAVIGFGTKAGLVPFHIWLPEAHPSAPSNVSALMSGVMIKIGVFGVLRIVFQVLGVGPDWWGFLLLALGGLSAIVGVLNAIAQHDLKRLLAFHSVENIGIIFMGLGAALVFLSLGSSVLAALALLAAVLHTLNHGLFKALLFLGAGAVVGATGTRDMEKMGGVVRAMPGVALGFLVGAMAISALPPFNGFVSEWLLFQAFFGAFATGSLSTEIAFTVAAATLALASGLAAYCFVKAFGVTFLARPRSSAAAEVSEDAPGSMRGGMALLAGACLAIGVVPSLFLGLFEGTLRELTGAGLPSYSPWAWLSSLPRPAPGSPDAGGTIAFGIVAVLLAVGIVAAWGFRRIGAKAPAESVPMWDCGMDAPSARMEYTASGYAQPMLRVFSAFYRPQQHSALTELGGARPGVLAKTQEFETEVEYPLVERGYNPLADGFFSLARRVGRLQSGGIHAYLAYMILTLVVLLIAVRFFGGVGP